jgi:hypothetical protein
MAQGCGAGAESAGDGEGISASGSRATTPQTVQVRLWRSTEIGLSAFGCAGSSFFDLVTLAEKFYC